MGNSRIRCLAQKLRWLAGVPARIVGRFLGQEMLVRGLRAQIEEQEQVLKEITQILQRDVEYGGDGESPADSALEVAGRAVNLIRESSDRAKRFQLAADEFIEGLRKQQKQNWDRLLSNFPPGTTIPDAVDAMIKAGLREDQPWPDQIRSLRECADIVRRSRPCSGGSDRPADEIAADVVRELNDRVHKTGDLLRERAWLTEGLGRIMATLKVPFPGLGTPGATTIARAVSGAVDAITFRGLRLDDLRAALEAVLARGPAVKFQSGVSRCLWCEGARVGPPDDPIQRHNDACPWEKAERVLEGVKNDNGLVGCEGVKSGE